MDATRTKRAKKPNPKYADSDYETIAALRKPTKQIKLDRRSSRLSEKETMSVGDTLKSTSSDEEEESVTTSNDSLSNEIASTETALATYLTSVEDFKVAVEDIKVEVGDETDEAIPISNGEITPKPEFIDTSAKLVIPSESSVNIPVIIEVPPKLETVANSLLQIKNESKLKEPSPDVMDAILRHQISQSKRLQKIETQLSNIFEVLRKGGGLSKIKQPIKKDKEPVSKNYLKKKSNK